MPPKTLLDVKRERIAQQRQQAQLDIEKTMRAMYQSLPPERYNCLRCRDTGKCQRCLDRNGNSMGCMECDYTGICDCKLERH